MYEAVHIPRLGGIYIVLIKIVIGRIATSLDHQLKYYFKMINGVHCILCDDHVFDDPILEAIFLHFYNQVVLEPVIASSSRGRFRFVLDGQMYTFVGRDLLCAANSYMKLKKIWLILVFLR